ncbi:hypothetical protein [Pseudomonas sp. REB1044]|uniref:hypothetical protein n=1 Tax=Pseudomonas sp. REB1044 TaxID=2675224 RepID=UPI00315D6F77
MQHQHGILLQARQSALHPPQLLAREQHLARCGQYHQTQRQCQQSLHEPEAALPGAHGKTQPCNWMV